MPFRIRVPTGYDLLSTIHSWIYPDIQPVPETTGDGFFGRVYDIHDEPTVLLIKQTQLGETLHISASSADIRRHDIVQLVTRTLGLEIAMEDALEAMRKDSVIAHLVRDVEGIRPYMSPTPFEALMKTIIQQQISYRAANIFTRRMILGLSKPLTFKNGAWYSFPDAKKIEKIGVDGIKAFGFGYKAEYIHGVSRLVAEGDLELDSLVGVPYEEVLEVLKPIRGIGEWTVRVLSLSGLGNFSIFAFNDLVIQKVLGKLYNRGIRLTSKQVREQAQIWGDSGTMVLYLLMCAEVLGLIDK